MDYTAHTHGDKEKLANNISKLNAIINSYRAVV